MGSISGVSLLLLVVSVSFLTSPSVQGGKILVFPVDGSHWVNMNLLIQSLHDKGHEVTVVRTATSWYIKENAPHYHSITVTLPEAIAIEEQDFFVTFLVKMLTVQKQGATLIGFVNFYWEMLSALSKIHQQASLLGVEIFENKTLMQSIRDAQFDMVLLDPGLPVGVLVAHELKLPTVFNVRWITSGEGHFVVAPSPSSYVPTSGCAVSDKMTFVQRVKNVFHYALNTCIDKFIVCPHYDRLVDRYFGPDVNFYHLLQGADIWLMRVDFVFEFPRPTMPNIVYIGGFQCKPSEPLSSELEEFVQSSGEHGFILMSLGTLVKGLPIEITSEIAAAFAQIPQKVIWRHAGEPPNNLGNNTRLVKWMPQNDLLGHPQIKAFVAHGGTNGIYESIFHGVPIVGIPLLFDQFENVLRLEARGAAKVVDATKLTRQSFLEAIQEVLHNPTYRNNMKRLSALHLDKPMHPLETAVYWIEFVMRHKGASHLRTESYKMPRYAYYSVDVICFLLAILLMTTAIVVGSIRFLCFRLCRRRKPKQE
ncbi:UDP-glucuronosyltransferase 2B15-like [Siniperca chuatsi]|uniref:UDP-glucuronosyltransferase 2B15-like n=1 Tax=Siniperca chuatsi TaxID=119488 RepID=UPI001CE18640|nr:UDP-glucuronosyltransferase 2B15-like [Siniperca chuatsi]XP_044035493.1 UDP-glucuronosyltransferase 2B15-like [Siniperca chuatsi]XP_044035494.1 UDP-glucuronosyltransferase 2B15-like [Siniperca chuatsi]